MKKYHLLIAFIALWVFSIYAIPYCIAKSQCSADGCDDLSRLYWGATAGLLGVASFAALIVSLHKYT